MKYYVYAIMLEIIPIKYQIINNQDLCKFHIMNFSSSPLRTTLWMATSCNLLKPMRKGMANLVLLGLSGSTSTNVLSMVLDLASPSSLPFSRMRRASGYAPASRILVYFCLQITTWCNWSFAFVLCPLGLNLFLPFHIWVASLLRSSWKNLLRTTSYLTTFICSIIVLTYRAHLPGSQIWIEKLILTANSMASYRVDELLHIVMTVAKKLGVCFQKC
jgi:hypothetical protein